MQLKTLSLALAATAFAISATTQAASYQPWQAQASGCDSLSVACDGDQGFIFGAQYVGLLDATGDYLGKGNQLLSGVYLETGWQFHQGLDVMLNWTGQFEQTVTRGTPTFKPGNGPTPERDSLPFTEQHHIVNLEVGKNIHAGPNTNMRFHLGLQYLNVQRESSFEFERNNGQKRISSGKQTFNGFGPRAGFSAEYWFPAAQWLAVDGAIAASVLVGDSKINVKRYDVPTDSYVLNETSNLRVVSPGIDGHVGIKVDLSKTDPSMQNVPVEIVSGYRWYTYSGVMNNNIKNNQDFLINTKGQGHFGAHGFFVGARTKLSADMFGGWF